MATGPSISFPPIPGAQMWEHPDGCRDQQIDPMSRQHLRLTVVQKSAEESGYIGQYGTHTYIKYISILYVYIDHMYTYFYTHAHTYTLAVNIHGESIYYIDSGRVIFADLQGPCLFFGCDSWINSFGGADFQPSCHLGTHLDTCLGGANPCI